MNVGLKHALVAIYFFRARNARVPAFRRAQSASKRQATISRRADRVRLARKHIVLARQNGWRGSVIAAISRRGGAA